MATAKRQFGAVDKLPSGRWRVRYRDAAGRRVTAPTTFKAKADANAYLAVVQSDLVRGQYIDPRGPDDRGLLVRELAAAAREACGDGRSRHTGIAVLLPRIGGLALAAVTPRHIQEAVDERSRDAEPGDCQPGLRRPEGHVQCCGRCRPDRPFTCPKGGIAEDHPAGTKDLGSRAVTPPDR